MSLWDFSFPPDPPERPLPTWASDSDAPEWMVWIAFALLTFPGVVLVADYFRSGQ